MIYPFFTISRAFTLGRFPPLPPPLYQSIITTGSADALPTEWYQVYRSTRATRTRGRDYDSGDHRKGRCISIIHVLHPKNYLGNTVKGMNHCPQETILLYTSPGRESSISSRVTPSGEDARWRLMLILRSRTPSLDKAPIDES